MARATVPFDIPAGVLKGAGPIEGRGRFIDLDKIRFRAGKAEKIGGWERLSLAQSPMAGIARAASAWNDASNDNTTVTVIGTTERLYTLDVEDNTLVDITPQLRRWELSGAFSTTSGSPTVTVHHEGHGMTPGTVVILDEASQSVGGLDMNGTRTIVATPTADTWTFTHSSNATATEARVGIVNAVYRQTLTNAFKTVNGSPTVTVAWALHGLSVGRRFTFSGGITVGGLAMDGSWSIASVPDVNTFTFTHTANATSTVAVATGSPYVALDIAPLDADPAGGYGYGIGDYGEEAYGTPRSATNVYFQPGYWTLTNFGRFMLGNPLRGSLYVWDPQASPTLRAARVATAPAIMKGSFVTPERFVVAWGASPDSITPLADPMLLRWCSQADYTDWVPSEFNTANSRRLTEGKELMAGGVIGEGLSMIWTDTAAYSMRYTGSRFVFETRLAGTGAGIVGPTAWCEAHGRAYWYGNGRFHTYGGGIDQIPRQQDILPWLHANTREAYLAKTFAFFNAAHNEVWWLFVTGDDDSEPNAYVAYSLEEGAWTTGTLERTAAYVPGTGGDMKPHLIGADGYIYVHETGVDANGAPMAAFLETGPFQVEEGESLVSIVGYIPDFSTQSGDVSLSIKARDRSPTEIIDTDAAEIAPGEGLVDVKLRGRHVSVRLEQSVLGGTFGIGSPAIQIMNGGRKR